jgi:group I intron endonuclease
MANKFYIYLITNLKNGKVYVGKSVDPSGRWHDHKKVALGGKEKYPNDFFAVHAALAKYGIDNFSFEIIDQFDSEEESYLAETAMIQLTCSNLTKYGYNCNLGGLGGIVPNEETRQKLIIAQNKPEMLKQKSDAMKKRHQDNPGFLSSVHKGNQYTTGMVLSDDHKQKISDKLKGREFSKEHKQNISKAISGENHPMYGKHISEETKRKKSEAMTGKNNPFFGKTHTEEIKEKFRGENNKQAKITAQQVTEIRKLFATGNYYQKDIAKMYNISNTSVSLIISRKTWKHI